MSALLKILFVDRDGTLIEEPQGEQIDGYEKLRLLPGVIAALLRFVRAGYALVMVSNQDGLGTPSFPEADFVGPQNLLLDILATQGIVFHEVLIDRHFERDNAPTRKPGIGLVEHYLRGGQLDFQASVMVGDRVTDIQFAERLGIRGFRIGTDNLDWAEIARQVIDAPRRACCERSTAETRVSVTVDLDSEQGTQLASGIGFFDHMLEQLARHGGFALKLECRGDLRVDEHHTVEDCALTLGSALRKALGDKRGIARYGFLLPMDEARAEVALDLSGRPLFDFVGQFPRDRVGDLPTELVPHFFRSLTETLGATLHLKVQGDNTHHMVEACFKAVGRALRQALRREGSELPSTKGVL